MKIIKLNILILCLFLTLTGCQTRSGVTQADSDRVALPQKPLEENLTEQALIERTFDIGAVCNVALDAGLRNRYDVLTEQERYSQYRNRLCQIEASTLEQFEGRAGSLGLNIPLAKGMLGLSGSRSSQSGRFQSAYSEFCASTYADNTFRSRFSQSIAEVNETLANNWERCHSQYLNTYLQLNQTGTFISFVPQDDYQQFTVEVTRKDTRVGDTSIENISPESVRCRYGSQDVIPGATTIDSNNFTLNCVKPEYSEVRFSLMTQAGVSNAINVPMDVLKYQELEEKYRFALSRLDNTDNELENAHNRIRQLESRKIQFKKVCQRRNADCSAGRPACPSGFSQAFTEDNTWVGGRCGNGNICNVCFKFD